MLTLGVKAFRKRPDYPKWARQVFHEVVGAVLEPLKNAMRDGIKLLWRDGKERFCYPMLCQYIGDMEE